MQRESGGARKAREVLSKSEHEKEQGWRSGESARLPPMCPGFDSRTRRHKWAEFVGSLLCSGYGMAKISNKESPIRATTV